MKKILFILFAIFAIAASSAENINTVYVDMPARFRVLQDSTFSIRVRSVNSNDIQSEIKNDTIYFRTNKSDLENAVIFITTPNPDELIFKTSGNYEIVKH